MDFSKRYACAQLSKPSALRAAQLALIRSLRAGEVKVNLKAGTFVLPEDPAFWAPFVLVGEPH